MIAGMLYFGIFLPSLRIDYELLHALAEGIGAFVAFLLAMLISTMIQQNRLSINYLWLIACFVAMGILDLAQSMASPGQTFVWLHSCATFFGGILASLIWLSPSASRAFYNKRFIWVISMFFIL